jgi:hypothetical protein
MTISKINPDNREGSDDNVNVDSFPQKIKSIIATLRIVIDQLDLDFKQAKELILEIARRLDEEGLCERNQISRTIKKILKDKIQEGKVSEKWIEECLAPEYKRKYTKSEPSSLSKQQHKQQIVEVSTEGQQVLPSEDVNQFHDHSKQNGIGNEAFSYNKPTANTVSSIIGDSVSSYTVQKLPSNSSDIGECSSCIELQDKVNQLTEALKRISIPTADQISPSGFEIPIPKENYEMVKDAMGKSKNAIVVKCDAGKKFVRAVPDVDN